MAGGDAVSPRSLFWCGLLSLLAGGALLAFGGHRLGTGLGTALGLAGIGLIGWWWAGRRDVP